MNKLSLPHCPYCRTRDEVTEERYLVLSPVRAPVALVIFSSIATLACAYLGLSAVETGGFVSLAILPAVIYFRERWHCSRCDLEFTTPQCALHSPQKLPPKA